MTFAPLVAECRIMPLIGETEWRLVFGRVVDLRSSIIEEGKTYWKSKGVNVDWAKFAEVWRAGYQPIMGRVRRGELPWTNLDGLHRMLLEGVLKDHGFSALTWRDFRTQPSGSISTEEGGWSEGIRTT